jgi:two-component system, NarL family, sensor histidine kinase UhpB
MLLASLLFGGLLTYEHALSKVRTEMDAAIAVGQSIVHNAVDSVEEETNPDLRLRRVVDDFDGDRHLRASLVDDHHVVLAASTLLEPSDPAPDWFYRFLAEQSETVDAPLPNAFKGHGFIKLQTDSHNEIAEVWTDVKLTLLILLVFCALVLALVFWILGYALRPLEEVAVAFARLGGGDYPPQLAERGPQELFRLCHGFNQMVDRLMCIEARDRQLQEQLLAVQEEERADLARDLHDEIGPFLFAVDVDATMIPQLVKAGAHANIIARSKEIREAVAHMKKHVKAILIRLRPGVSLDFGLTHAVRDLAAFWQRRQPGIAFNIDLSEESFGNSLDMPIYRVIQESVSNAVRHGQSTRIEVSVTRDGEDAIVVNVSDDGTGLPTERQRTGFGLAGMQERVLALGGTLIIQDRSDPRGVMVSARLPVSVSAEVVEP